MYEPAAAACDVTWSGTGHARRALVPGGRFGAAMPYGERAVWGFAGSLGGSVIVCSGIARFVLSLPGSLPRGPEEVQRDWRCCCSQLPHRC